MCGFPGPAEEHTEVVIAKSDVFISLAPGESHTTGPIHFYPYHYFLKEFEAGVKYSYQYTGGEISWWDWGTKEVGHVFPPPMHVSMHIPFFLRDFTFRSIRCAWLEYLQNFSQSHQETKIRVY